MESDYHRQTQHGRLGKPKFWHTWFLDLLVWGEKAEGEGQVKDRKTSTLQYSVDEIR